MGLAVLASEWVQEARLKTKLTGWIVDHGLRPESGAEAEQTAEWLTKYASGVDPKIVRLDWADGGAPQPGQTQIRAREARYQALEAEMAASGIQSLLTGHQMTDNIETLLLRLGHHSGLDGYACIPEVRPLSWASPRTLIRPLLAATRADLGAFLEARNVPFHTDPSNTAPMFQRTGLRQLVVTLEDAGTPQSTFGAVIAACVETKARRAAAAQAVLSTGWEYNAIGGHGVLDLDPGTLAGAPAPVRSKILAKVASTVNPGKATGQLRLGALARAAHKLLGPGAPPPDQARPSTFGGCLFTPRPSGGYLVTKQPLPLVAVEPLQIDSALLWEDSLVVTASLRQRTSSVLQLAPHPLAGRKVSLRAPEIAHSDQTLGTLRDWSGSGLAVRRTTAADWSLIIAAKKANAFRVAGQPPLISLRAVRSIPVPARTTIPAIIDSAGILALPHLGYIRPGNAAKIFDFGVRPP